MYKITPFFIFLLLTFNACGDGNSNHEQVNSGREQLSVSSNDNAKAQSKEKQVNINQPQEQSISKPTQESSTKQSDQELGDNVYKFVDDDGEVYYYDENDNLQKVDNSKGDSEAVYNSSNNHKNDNENYENYEDDGSFAPIKRLIHSGHATYIMVGDSTRSYHPVYQNQYVFETIKAGLSPYGVKCINKAQTGMKAKEFADASSSRFDWHEVANMIEGDGSTTIIDLSLGINDYDDIDSENSLEYNLEKIIDSIRSRKPKVHFILTVPNRVYYSPESMTDKFESIYRDLANRYNFPLIDIPNEAMPLDEISLSWYRDGDQTHLKRPAQERIARVILSKII